MWCETRGPSIGPEFIDQHHGEQLASRLDQRRPKLAGPPLASCSLQWWSCRQHNFHNIFSRLLVLWEYSLRLLWFCWRIQLSDRCVPSRGEQFSGVWKNSVLKLSPLDYKVFIPLFRWVFCQEQDIAGQRKQEQRQTGQGRKKCWENRTEKGWEAEQVKDGGREKCWRC